MQLEIRDAKAEDAADALRVLKRSIAELCVADHRNDPKILESWLSNKTTGNFVGWVNQPDNSVLVALENGHILAVGSVTDAGMIGLNYVSPDARFQGRQPGPAGRPRSPRFRARQHALLFDQHGD